MVFVGEIQQIPWVFLPLFFLPRRFGCELARSSGRRISAGSPASCGALGALARPGGVAVGDFYTRGRRSYSCKTMHFCGFIVRHMVYATMWYLGLSENGVFSCPFWSPYINIPGKTVWKIWYDDQIWSNISSNRVVKIIDPPSRGWFL